MAESAVLVANPTEGTRALSSLMRVTLPSLADWCVVDVVERDCIRRVAVAHHDPEQMSLVQSLLACDPFHSRSTGNVRHALLLGRVVVHNNIPEEVLEEGATYSELVAIMRRLGLLSSMTVPLSANGKTIGAVSLVSTKRSYARPDVDKRGPE